MDTRFQAARVSYGRETAWSRSIVIRYLMSHWHTTPFEMASIKLHVKPPIFVVGGYGIGREPVNEYSARYSVLDREFYVPCRPRSSPRSLSNNRQGRGARLEGDEAERVLAMLREDASRTTTTTFLECLTSVRTVQSSDPTRVGVARETARMNLTLNTYTQ